MNQTDLTSRLALDSRGFESLKQTARTDPVSYTHLTLPTKA